MIRCRNYAYRNRYGDKLGTMDVAWTALLASQDGAHYHFWFPKGPRSEIQSLQGKAMTAARREGDPVSFSYDYIPDEGREHE